MTSEQFAYWLQGFTELNPGMESPSPEQWQAIREHLSTVFVKVTPPFARDQVRDGVSKMLLGSYEERLSRWAGGATQFIPPKPYVLRQP